MCSHGAKEKNPTVSGGAGRRGRHSFVLGAAKASSTAGQPTWEGGEAAGEGAGLVLWPEPLLQLGLQGIELPVAAIDEVLGSPFRLHLNNKDLERTETRGTGLRGQGQKTEGRGSEVRRV